MKTLLLKTAMLLLALLTSRIGAQVNYSSPTDSLAGFNEEAQKQFFLQSHSSLNSAYTEFIENQKKDFIRNTFYPIQKQNPSPSLPQVACTNMDFEAGNLTGWTSSTGYHPLYNAAGCCINGGGAQTIVSGNATDPCGGFPTVFPGGSFSVMIGNSGTGGIADRLEQTFTVTNANANYTYNYAVVLQDGGNTHTVAEQPSFRIDMLDQNGNVIPCTDYYVAGGQGIPGFQTSANCANAIYKPWTTVSVDLTAYLNQNVTIRFTTYDCALGGHYAYAYIDGACTDFQILQSDTLCVGGSINLCAPAGYASYSWNGPNVNNVNAQCITVSNAGVYTVGTTSVTGCSSPVLTYQLASYPKPNANFHDNLNGNASCSRTVQFTNTSATNGATISSYFWSFGDGTNSTQQSPSHTYLNSGTYTITLIAYTNIGCSDTTSHTITVSDGPIANFGVTDVCLGSTTIFQNNTTLATNYNWLFGDNTRSSLATPTHLYTSTGSFTITLIASNNFGCADTVTEVAQVFQNPSANFNAAAVCLGNATQFNNQSTGVGIVSYAWNLGDGNSSAVQNPNHSYTNYGSYLVSLTVTNNNSCSSSATITVNVNETPQANFSNPNICSGSNLLLTDNSSSSTTTINNWLWNFGDGITSNLQNPQHIYSLAGTYQINLTVSASNGCSQSVSNPINVYALPVSSFTANSACLGTAINFTNTSSITSGTIVSYAWDFNSDGQVDNTSFSPSQTFASAGNYTINLTAISNQGCSKSSTNSITVYPLPVANFSATNNCLGVITPFSNTSSVTSPETIVSSSWAFADGTYSNLLNPSHTYTSDGTYLVTLTATTNHGCQASVANNVVIHPVANVNFSSNIVCHNSPTQFNNSSSINTGNIIAWEWDFNNDGVVDNNTMNPIYTYPAAGNFNVKLTATSNNNCVSNTTNPAIVHYNPVAQFTVNESCLGQATQYANTSFSVDGNITSYLWDYESDGNNDNVGTSPSTTFANAATYVTSLEIQTQYGCIASTLQSVTVNPLPNVSFSNLIKTGCPTLCVNFTNTSNISTGNIGSFVWNFGDNTALSYAQNPQHCFETGDYNVSLTAISDKGCSAQQTLNNAVVVYPKPIAGFEIAEENIDIIENSIHVNNLATGATTWAYSLTDNSQYTTQSFSHTFTSEIPQDYFITQIVNNTYGCFDTLVKPLEVKPAFTLYVPNAFSPNDDNKNETFTGKGIGIKEFKMWIFDRWGNEIYYTEDINKGWDGTFAKHPETVSLQDVFVYKINVKDDLEKKHEKNGTFTLVR